MKKVILVLFLSFTSIFASNHGIYLLALKNAKTDCSSLSKSISDNLKTQGFNIYAVRNLATPDIVREEKTELCGFNAMQILFSSPEYIKMLDSYGKKYIAAGFLRIGIYETPSGTQVNIADPETINRIVFNDLYDNDEIEKYNRIIELTKSVKNKIISAIHDTKLGEAVNIPMEPIRSDEDLAEASKDMFMMVGSMTFFSDEDQFPIIYETKSSNAKADIQKLLITLKSNLKNQKPSNDDIEYRLTKSPDVLKWEIIGEIYSPDSNAVLLGVTRPRTEGLSFNIAGKARETGNDKCPGIDHAPAYPIEVIIYYNGENIVVQTARQMFRMDMYFWDAGMMAFMDHMSMPDILDVSLRKALLGNLYED